MIALKHSNNHHNSFPPPYGGRRCISNKLHMLIELEGEEKSTNDLDLLSEVGNMRESNAESP
ncbi:MAG: hypothetical protein ACXAEU_12965 [Candidatus Hodarchaeales archaeon]|jgi:hypothetical protein